MTVSVCKQCNLRGYELIDDICHLCVARNNYQIERVAEYQAILDQFLEQDYNSSWRGCEFGKAIIGNILVDLIRANTGVPKL